VLSFSHVLNFFAHEFSRLGGSRFPLPLILASSLECFLFWHDSSSLLFCASSLHDERIYHFAKRLPDDTAAISVPSVVG
jgi:hypothetical protein